MTKAVYEPDDFHLRIEGHAEAAKPIDPICAGISALAWALVEASTDRACYRAALFLDDRKGIIDVRCDPENGARKDCRYMFEIIVGGLQLIAQRYPDNLQIIGG